MLERMIGIAKEDNGLYYFENGDRVKRYATMVEISLPPVSNKDVIALHHKLGHPNFHHLKYLFLYLFINKSLNSFTVICQLAKYTRTPFPIGPYKKSHPFSHHTRVCWVYLYNEKLKVAKKFQNFCFMVKKPKFT